MLRHFLSRLFRSDSAGRHAVGLSVTCDELLALARSGVEDGDIELGRRHLERAVEIDPAHAGVLHELGYLAAREGRTEAAAGYFTRAIAADPRAARTYNSFGSLHFSNGDFDQAARMFREAIRLEPGLAQAHANLGMVLCEQGDPEAGIGSLRRATELDPELAEAHNAMGITLASRGDVENGIENLRRAVQLKPDSPDIHSNLIMTLGLDARTSLAEHFAERRRWQRQHVEPLRLVAPQHGNPPDPARRIRVGYVSADFRRHSAAYAFGPMVLDYDRHAFQVSCYSNSRLEDAVTARFRNSVDRWRDICGVPDADAAGLMREDGIDILVDLSGHTVGNRLLLFARKPAPVQVTAWGGVTGTGLDAMDYILADDVLIPGGMRRFFTEEVVRLPSTLTYLPQAELPPLAPLPAIGRGLVTFGYFNNYIKLSQRALALWVRLLAAVPSSRLLLKAREFDRAQPRERILSTFASAGVAPERLSFLGRSSWYEHLAALGDVDIALDPFPNVGGASTLEALAMGTPVVTLIGETPANRISAASLTAVGLGDWVAETEEQYLSIACAWAGNIPGLERLRSGLRGRFASAPLGNPREYVRAVEAAYRTLWQRWCRRQRLTAGSATDR